MNWTGSRVSALDCQTVEAVCLFISVLFVCWQAILFPLSWRWAGLKLTEEVTSSSSRCSKMPTNQLFLDPNLTKYQLEFDDVAVCLSVTVVAQPRGLHRSKILDPIQKVPMEPCMHAFIFKEKQTGSKRDSQNWSGKNWRIVSGGPDQTRTERENTNTGSSLMLY